MGKVSEKAIRIVILGTGRQARLLYFGLELSDEAFEILGVYGETEKDGIFEGFPVNKTAEITGIAGAEFDLLFCCMETDTALRDMLGKAFGRDRVRSWDEIREFLTSEQKERWLDRLRKAAEEDPGYALTLSELLGKTKNAEEEYLYLLLASALCRDQEQAAAVRKRTAADTAGLDSRLLQELLEKMVCRMIAAGKYDSAFAFLGNLLFQKNKYLFSKILDRWVRYYYILLEIAICERKRGSEHTVIEIWADWREFETPLREFKFAFRRIWFGFAPKEQRWLLSLAERYRVSADCLAVLCKGAVHEDYVASVLKRSAELFQDAGQERIASGLLSYADVFERMHPGGKPCMTGENRHYELTVTELDAGQNGTVSDTGARVMESSIRSGYQSTASDTGDKMVESDIRSGHQSPVSDTGDRGHDVACIMCVNDDDYVKEMILYLKRQKLPEGYRLCLYPVRGAESMTAGYELARESISAEIKIYLHQDTFIFDEEYLRKLIEALRRDDYAMLGLAGSGKLPKSAVWGESAPEDMKFCLYQDFTLQVIEAVTDSFKDAIKDSFKDFLKVPSGDELAGKSGESSADLRCQETECIDGVLMATKENVPWREDLFNGFHFYDISQCMEYRKRGYRIGIFENGGHAGVLHEVNVSKNETYERSYEKARQKFLQEYRENFRSEPQTETDQWNA